MELRYFFEVLSRRKWILLASMLIAMLATYILVSRLPKAYKSNAILSTGITIDKKLFVGQDNPFVQEFQIENKFSNLVEFIKSRSTVKLLSIDLLKHDLDKSKTAFSKPEKDDLNFSDDKLQSFANVLNGVKDSSYVIDFKDPDMASMFTKVAKAYGYDYENIIEKEKLEVKRIGDSDNLNVTFTSHNPELSKYAVETFCNKFMTFYFSQQNTEERQSLGFYTQLEKEKALKVDTLGVRLRNMRLNKNLIDLDKQGEAVVAQVKELEISKGQLEKEIGGLQKNLGILSAYDKDSESNRLSKESDKLMVNSEFKLLKEQIEELNRQWVATNLKDKTVEQKIKSLQAQQSNLFRKEAELRKKETDKTPERNEEIFKKKLDTDLELNQRTNAVAYIKTEIARLKGQQLGLVDADGYLKTLEDELRIAEDEHKDAAAKLNTAKQLLTGSVNPITMTESPQMPEKPESNKAVLLSLFSGVATGVLGSLLVFLFTYLDTRMASPTVYRKLTGNLPLLGMLNKINIKNIEFSEFMKPDFDNKTQDVTAYKEALRKVRHQIEVSEGSSFLFTSLKPSEGKSFVLLSLAYSLSLSNKKILIIDANFKNNTLTKYSKQSISQSENAFDGDAATSSLNIPNVDIIGNKGGNYSPSEMLGNKDFGKILRAYAQKYDYIFLEAAALNKYSDTRELVSFVDKVICVYSADEQHGSADRDSNEYLKSLGGKYLGGILNNIDIKDYVV